MNDSKAEKGSVEESRSGRPAGILVLDQPPAQPSSFLGAYFWSRERLDHSAVPCDGSEKPRPWALMVGPKGSLPQGDWAFGL